MQNEQEKEKLLAKSSDNCFQKSSKHSKVEEEPDLKVGMFVKSVKSNLVNAVLILTSWSIAIIFLALYLDALNNLNKKDNIMDVFAPYKIKSIDLDKSYYNTWTKHFETSLQSADFTNATLLRGNLGLKISNENLKNINLVEEDDMVRIEYTPFDTYKSVLEIKLNTKTNTQFKCNSYKWEIHGLPNTLNPIFEDCFQLTDAFWYGGAESYTQQFWPINNQMYDYKPYLSGLFGTSSAVLERYWLSSNGVAIVVNQSVPLFVSMNKTSICFLATNKYPYPIDNHLSLQYDICNRITMEPERLLLQNLQLFMVDNYLGKPTGVPDDLMFKRPIWSTWANFKKNINEENVLQYAQDIVTYNYSNSQIEIDDEWAVKYGDFEFDQKKFPNMKAFVKSLKDLGFRVTLWMHPFANSNSDNFVSYTYFGFWVSADGKLPALTEWWNGAGGILDVTNADASAWFVSELSNLRSEYGIDSFKFDAGEVQWLPKCFTLKNASTSPDDYSKKYSEMAYQLGNMIEVRTGCQTQSLPIFVRMLDKDSNWNITDNGLKSVVTTALVMGILGYPFILPDMIGGNAYAALSNNTESDAFNANLSATIYPDYELFIRWAQLTAFMPSMQFSIPPWHYTPLTNVKVNEVCKKFVDFHESVVYPVLKEFAPMATKNGAPIIRPLWWINSLDQNNLIIFDEFLVGDKFLVAPIVEKGAVQRNIYLPDGHWKDGNTGEIFTGPKWLYNYHAPIDIIPYFVSIISSHDEQ